MALHAWSGYRTYAWGSDELKPLSKQGYNWYETGSLLSTAVDALSTLHLMGLMNEYDEAKALVLGAYETIDPDTGLPVFMHELGVRRGNVVLKKF
jgi:mannosyl-oligosaccharide alpha-1,2-mannosidase